MIETDLVSLVSALVAGRVYPDMAPQSAALPRVVYQQVGGDAPTYIDDVVPSLRNARMQITAWSRTRAEATTIALAIESLLTTSAAMQARPMGAISATHEPDTGLYGARQDFTIWSDR